MRPERLRELESHLLHTGIKRRAASVANNYVKKLDGQQERMRGMRAMVDEGYAILTGRGSLAAFASPPSGCMS